MRNINPKIYLIDSIIVFLKFILWVQIVAPIICACIGCLYLLISTESIDHFGMFYKNHMLPFQCFLTFVVILGVFAKKYYQHLRLRTKSREKSSLRVIFMLFLISVSFSFIDSFIDDVINLTNINAASFNILDHSVLGVISTCLLGPLAEELTFRGTIEIYLLKWKKNPLVAIFLSALLFGIMHINPSQVESAFVFGILLGWVYYKSGSIIPSLILHVLNNFYCFILDIYGYGSSSVQDFCNEVHTPLPIVMILSIVLLSISLFAIYPKTNRKHVMTSTSE